MIEVTSSIKNGILRSYVVDEINRIDALIEFTANISSTYPSFTLIDFTDNDSETYDSDCESFEYPRIFKHRNIHVETVKEYREEEEDDEYYDSDNYLIFNVCFGSNLNDAIINSIRKLAIKKIDEDVFLDGFNKTFHRLLNHQTERGGFGHSEFKMIPYATRKLISLITINSVNPDIVDEAFIRRYETMKAISEMNIILVKCNNRIKIIPPAIDYLCSTLFVEDIDDNDCNTVMIDDDGYLVTGKGQTKCNPNAKEIQAEVSISLSKLENSLDISKMDNGILFTKIKDLLSFAQKELRKFELPIVLMKQMHGLDVQALLLTILANGLYKKPTDQEMPF